MTFSGKRSLRTNFLLSLTIGAVVITFLGAFSTYRIASQQLHDQLVQRGKLLASAINHSAMIANNETELAHVAEEVMKDNPEVSSLIILPKDGNGTIFEGFVGAAVESRETSEHLKAEARRSLDTKVFGIHSDHTKFLTVTAPLTTPVGSHAIAMNIDPVESAGGISQHSDMTMPGHVSNTLSEPGPTQIHPVQPSMSMGTLQEHVGHSHAESVSKPMRPATKSMSMGTFGVVLILFDRQSVMRGLEAILWRLMPTSAIGIGMTLILCFSLLHRQVLKPIGEIRSAMMRQEAGEQDARAGPQSSLEIDDVASTLNRMLDSLKEREELIRELALTDSLTGLANRSLFRQKLHDAFQTATRAESKVAVLFIDLDHFKVINDVHGHAKGDTILKAVTVRLTDEVREVDTVARLGGDEFSVVAVGWKNFECLHRLALRIIDGVSGIAAAAGITQSTEVSIGIAIYPDDAKDLDDLVRRADLALYQAKDAGRGVYRIYDDQLHTKTLERQRLEQDLHRAVDDGQLLLHYQPEVDIKTGELKTVEALVRWLHPERGLLPPAEFVPVAEASGLIVRLGDWVLSTACRRNLAWQEEGMAPFRVAVNVSAREIQLETFSDRVEEILVETGLDPQWLELEVTETTVLSDLTKATTNLRKLAELGVVIAIDDFGTGHSSLSNLRRLPFEKLKIDRSFTCNLAEDVDDRAITEAIINLGRNLGLTVIAEGVETQAQLRVLETLRCDVAQGYGIGRPMDTNDLTAWIAGRTVCANVSHCLLNGPASVTDKLTDSKSV